MENHEARRGADAGVHGGNVAGPNHIPAGSAEQED